MKKQIILVVIIITLFLQVIASSYIANEALCCTMFLLSVMCRKKYESFTIYDIFLVTEFLFCFDVIFGDLFGLYNLHVFDHFGQVHTFNNNQLITSFKTFSFFQAGVCIPWLYKNDEAFVPMKDKVQFTNTARKLSLVFFYILFIPALISKLFIVYSAIVFGYVESVQLGELVNSNYFIYIGSSLFEVTSAFCLYLSVDKKEFERLAIIYAIPNVLLIFTGQRGPAIVTILFMLWLYNIYVEKLNLRYISLSGAFFVIILPLIGQWRGDTSDLKYTGVADWIFHFFFSQGMSFNVVPFTVDCLNDFSNKVPFLFGYLTDLLHPTQAYTIDSITHGNYLAYHLAYHVYGNVYFLGHTMGTSLIAELYELAKGHYYLVLPFSYVIMKMTIYFSHNLYKNPITFVIGVRFIMCFIYSPRDSVGKVLSFTILYTIIFTLIMYVLFKKKNINI